MEEPAKKHKGKTPRSSEDNYPTPQPLVDAICDRLFKFLGQDFAFIVEPSAGNGNFVEAARRVWPFHQVHAIDIRDERTSCMARGASSFTQGDWPAILRSWRPKGPGLVLGNPPFSMAAQHIAVVQEVMDPGTVVAFLLKMNFFGGKIRSRGFWPTAPFRCVIPIEGRPSFKKTELATNDTNEYGIFIFQNGWTEKPTIEFPHIIWKEKVHGAQNLQG